MVCTYNEYLCACMYTTQRLICPTFLDDLLFKFIFCGALRLYNTEADLNAPEADLSHSYEAALTCPLFYVFRPFPIATFLIGTIILKSVHFC